MSTRRIVGLIIAGACAFIAGVEASAGGTLLLNPSQFLAIAVGGLLLAIIP
jgi:hypothetical protein